jgi:predicted nucleic acid-binding protein
MVIIDTDIIIWILRGNESIRQKFERLVSDSSGKVFVSPIQIAEVYAGLRDAERIRTEEFFNALRLKLINEAVGKQAGEFIRKYRPSHNVTLADAVIAAVTVYYNLTLWTLNRKHYPMLSEEQFF